MTQKKNKNTNKTEWALISKSNPDQILKWFGEKKPSDKTVSKEEKRVQYWKSKGSKVKKAKDYYSADTKEVKFDLGNFEDGTLQEYLATVTVQTYADSDTGIHRIEDLDILNVNEYIAGERVEDITEDMEEAIIEQLET